VLRSTINFNEMRASETVVPKGPMSNLTWADYISFCGPRTSLRHRSSAPRAFESKFRNRNFRWQGEVLSIREGFQVLFMRSRSVIMVRMYPQRFQRQVFSISPDLALLFDEDRYEEVATLEPGSWVEFEAKMLSRGHRGDPEVMMLYYVGLAARPSPLDSSAFALRNSSAMFGAVALGNGSAALGDSLTANGTVAIEAIDREVFNKEFLATEGKVENESTAQMPPVGGQLPLARQKKSEEVV